MSQSPKILYLLAVGCVILQVTSGSSCRTEWRYHSGGEACYRYYDTAKTWSEAQSFCETQEANLVSIHGYEDQFYLRDVLAMVDRETRLWIGGKATTSSNRNATWHWSDGSPFTYTDWSYRHPSEVEKKKCIEYSSYGLRDWKNNDCSIKMGFLCKMKTEGINVNIAGPYCGQDWAYNAVSQVCYRLYHDLYMDKVSWTTAQQRCESENANLSSILDAGEQAAVRKFLYSQDARDKAWIGANLPRSDGEWQWSDGSPFLYNKFTDS